MRRLLLSLILLCSACSKQTPLINEFSSGTQIVESPIAYEPPKVPATSKFVYSESPDIQKAINDYITKGKAPIIKKPGFEIYPYEESEPVMYCQPLRACDVELEAGEEILGIALGDTVRWDIQTIYSGNKENLIPHVVVKPKELEVTTNMLISTTRRTYHMALISSEREYARRFKFYYPREFVNSVVDKEKLENKKKAEEAIGAISELPSVSADKLNFNYKIEDEGATSWRPVRAFDDGVHVYIQMPKLMASNEAPILMTKREAANSVTMVNYRVKNNYYIVDRLFTEAILLLGVGDHQERVSIVKSE